MTAQGEPRRSAYLKLLAEIVLGAAEIELGADAGVAQRRDQLLIVGDLPSRNTVTSTGPGAGLVSSLPIMVSAACSRDTPMEKPVAGTGSPRKRETSPS